jgi:GTP-binding protein LepA
MELAQIRNFCIIAHIDHGKSTLADRMMQLTQTVEDRDMREQLLDDMDIERERGITIKSRPVRMRYEAADGQEYEFNLIDTPGHVDFTYEVSRSMAACEGALLVVDAAQGIEAQTVANVYLAMENNLEIIPVINKVDLPNADPDGVAHQIEDVLALSTDRRLRISAKTGEGVAEVLSAIVDLVPAPAAKGDATENSTRALVFDSVYDAYRGVVSYVRMVEGSIKERQRVRLMASGRDDDIKEVGIFGPKPMRVGSLSAGQVGYVIGTLKNPADILIGDTLTDQSRPANKALPGFRRIQPMVFSGLYPVSAEDYEKFKFNLERLGLNDSAFEYIPETSLALGFGFRCGFLGLLHMEIVQERLRREFDLDIISTFPAVVYRVHLRGGESIEIDNPMRLPDVTRIEQIEEPMIRAFILCQNEHIGDIMRIVQDRRGVVGKTESIDTQRVMLTCTMPLNEILVEFHDVLKSVSRGYASMDYDHTGYVASDIVRLDILLNHEPVDAFACMVHRSRAEARGRQMCQALKEVIPPHMFAVPIQAALNKSVIARETVRALRKDVTAKCYGGDITRKRKLLERQKKGKKRMKQVGQVSVPQEAFLAVMKGQVT